MFFCKFIMCIILLIRFGLFFNIINYLVTFFLLVEIFTLLKKNNKTLEDNYQLSLRNKNNESLNIFMMLFLEWKKN